MEKINILGVKVDKITTKEVLQRFREFLDSAQKRYIVTPNPEFIITAQEDKEFKNILNKADIAVPDGAGLLWAAKFLKIKTKTEKFRNLEIIWQLIYSLASLIFYSRYCKTILPERISGSDLIWKIAEICEQKSCSIFLLGAQKNIASKTAQILQSHFTSLTVAGTYSGIATEKWDKKIVERINKANPDILFVAFGHPKQEKWIARNLNKLEKVKIAMGVGGTYDFITKKAKRAPKIFQNIGLEWLWRLVCQPWRLKRIYNAVIRFPLAVLKYKLTN